MNQFKRWFASPVFPEDEEKTHRAWLLNIILLTITLAAIVVLIGDLIGGKTPIFVELTNLVTIAASLILRNFMRKGHINMAGTGIMAIGLITVTAAIAKLGTIRTPTTALYIAFVIVAGLLFKHRGMLTSIVICSACVGGLILLENAGMLPKPDYSTTITQWVTYTALFMGIGSLTYASIQSTYNALAKAQKEITERKNAEAVSRESEIKYHAIFDASADAAFLETLNGEILDCNATACGLLGYTKEELLKLTVADLVPPETAQILPTVITEELNVGEYQFEALNKKKDGSVFPCEVRTHTIIINQQLRVIVFVRDLTDRKLSERALRESEAIYRQAIEVAGAVPYRQSYQIGGIEISYDFIGDGIRKITGYAPEEFNEDIWDSLVQESRLIGDLAKYSMEEAIHKVQLGEIPIWQCEHRIKARDGTTHWVFESAVELRNKNGVTHGSIGLFQDVTERKQAEENLRQSEEKFSKAFYTSPDAININRISDGDFVDVNRGFTALTGYTKQDVQDKPSLGIEIWANPEDRARLDEELDKHGEVANLEAQFRAKDGRVMTGLMSAAIVNVNNEPCIISITRDITERKMAERALQESESLYRQAIEVAGAVPYRQTYTGDGTSLRYEFIGEGIRKITGYGPEEFSAQLWDSLVQEIQFVGELAEYSFEDAIIKVRSGDIPIWQCEQRIRARDGTMHWIFEAAVELRDETGSSHGSIGMYQDITERKQIEQALRESEAIYRQAIEVAGAVPYRQSFRIGAGLGTVNINYDFVGDGIRQITGYGPEEFSERVWDSLLQESNLVGNLAIYSWKEALRKVRSGEIPVWQCEHRILARDGTTHWVFEAAVDLRDEVGTSHGSIGMFQDITERKLAADALKRANEELAHAYDATLEGWANALDLREHETAGHSRRVVEGTVRLAEQLGLTGEQLTHIRRGAILHDIGKIGIPDHILLKPSALNAEEWKIMRKHPGYGFDLLNKIPFLNPSNNIPHWHHEHWDGTGYPDGLMGEGIPLAARIFAIVDVWDALQSDRPYRKAWAKEQAIEYIREQSGKHFDPQIVETFLSTIAK